MSNALQVRDGGTALAEMNWTDEEVKLIRETVAKGATEAEFKLFMYRARHLNADPLKPGEIHFVKYGNNPGTVIFGIDHMRKRAGRTGLHRGTKRGVMRNEAGKLIGGWAEVYRADWDHPAREEVSFSEYDTGRANWKSMPETMIKKVAEAAALRLAFPDELGGLYSEEEIEHLRDESRQAKASTVQAIVDAPAEAVQVEVSEDPADYTVPHGPFAGQRLCEIDPVALAKYCVDKREQAQKQKKAIGGALKEMLEKAEAYLGGTGQ